MGDQMDRATLDQMDRTNKQTAAASKGGVRGVSPRASSPRAERVLGRRDLKVQLMEDGASSYAEKTPITLSPQASRAVIARKWAALRTLSQTNLLDIDSEASSDEQNDSFNGDDDAAMAIEDHRYPTNAAREEDRYTTSQHHRTPGDAREDGNAAASPSYSRPRSPAALP